MRTSVDTAIFEFYSNFIRSIEAANFRHNLEFVDSASNFTTNFVISTDKTYYFERSAPPAFQLTESEIRNFSLPKLKY